MSKRTKLLNVASFLPVGRDLDGAIAFYEQSLGFKKVREVGRFVTVQRDGVMLILLEEENEALAKELMVRIHVADIDALYEEYQRAEVARLGALEMKPWGKRAFSVIDPAGILIWFSEPWD